MATRRALIEAIAARYQSGTRVEKQKLLAEFIEVTKFHRKHAIRALRKVEAKVEVTKASPARLYDEAAVTALTTLREASDRICGKRLKQAIPARVDAMERYKHLQLDCEVRQRLLSTSAGTMDRLLKPICEVAKQGRRRTAINSVLRKSILVRTFSGWNDPAPGYFEMDMVAHCGKSVAGSHVHCLRLARSRGHNQTVVDYCKERALVRKLLQPSFKLKSKTRDGAKVSKQYKKPATRISGCWPAAAASETVAHRNRSPSGVRLRARDWKSLTYRPNHKRKRCHREVRVNRAMMPALY